MLQLIMKKFIPLKFFSLILVVAMLTVTINGVHESAHAMQSHFDTASDQASLLNISDSHQHPFAPLEQHQDYDGCDTCFNCSCHASPIVQPFRLNYNPIIISLASSDPFRYLPEVFLSKFIPPQNHA
jgi:hypothetical protein